MQWHYATHPAVCTHLHRFMGIDLTAREYESFPGHTSAVILRSRALARRLEGWATGCSRPSFEARRRRRAPQDDGIGLAGSKTAVLPRLTLAALAVAAAVTAAAAQEANPD